MPDEAGDRRGARPSRARPRSRSAARQRRKGPRRVLLTPRAPGGGREGAVREEGVSDRRLRDRRPPPRRRVAGAADRGLDRLGAVGAGGRRPGADPARGGGGLPLRRAVPRPGERGGRCGRGRPRCRRRAARRRPEREPRGPEAPGGTGEGSPGLSRGRGRPRPPPARDKTAAELHRRRRGLPSRGTPHPRGRGPRAGPAPGRGGRHLRLGAPGPGSASPHRPISPMPSWRSSPAPR